MNRQQINYIFHFVKQLWAERKIPQLLFGLPQVKKLVVVDGCNLSVLDRVILNDIDYGIINVRGEDVRLSPFFLFKVLKLARKNRISFYYAYLLAHLYYFQPRVVLTDIDTSNNLGVLSKYYPDAIFISIQNGFRQLEHIQSLKCIPIFYCFGNYEIELYSSHGLPVDEFRPIGSVKADYFRYNIATKRNGVPSYDVCLVSQYRLAIHKSDNSVWQTIRLMHSYLNRYIEEKQIRFCVALVGGATAVREQDYFNYLFVQADLIEANRIKFASYQAVHSSRVVVAFNSTLAFEAFGWGKKTLFCAGLGGKELSEKKNFRKPISDLMLLRSSDYSTFRRKIDELLVMSEKLFQLETEKDRYYVMHETVGWAHNAVRQAILEMLN